MANQTREAVTSRKNAPRSNRAASSRVASPTRTGTKGVFGSTSPAARLAAASAVIAGCRRRRVSARGARRDPHDFARRRDVDGDGATKHRNAVERLRERDVTHSRGSTHVVAHDRQRVQVSVLESEAIDVPHQPVAQGDRESRPRSGPAGSIQDAKRTGIRIQTRTATARERCAPELGPRTRRPLCWRAPLADVEVRAERARPDREAAGGRSAARKDRRRHRPRG